MKKILFLFALISTMYSCSLADKFNGDDKLPPETQTGANTVGCLVNGKVFLPHAAGLSPSVNCFYQFVDNEFFFNLHFTDLRNGGSESVVVQTSRINLQIGQTYNLNKNIVDNGDFTGGGGIYSPTGIRYYTNSIKTGELKITRLDLQHSIVSGTFWFDAINSAGEEFHITQGRFDWDY